LRIRALLQPLSLSKGNLSDKDRTMLDQTQYRLAEHIAKQQLPTWRIAQRHTLEVFEKAGFPVRANSFADLRPLIDTMQENRFDSYMRELGGLTPERHSLLMTALREISIFQLKHFNSQEIIIPLSTVISALAIYHKISVLKPSFRNILEIGPGCGYTSLFFGQHPGLENYSSVEACESFYLLQSLLGTHVFGTGFREYAAVPNHSPAGSSWHGERHFQSNDYEHLNTLDLSDSPQHREVCSHYPWWRIPDLSACGRTFDVITSNANLNEFSVSALTEYLSLSYQLLADDGIFFFQCPGWNHDGRDTNRFLYEAGFAPLFLAEGNVELRLGERDGSGERLIHQEFTVPNGVLIKRGHPLWAQQFRWEQFAQPTICFAEPRILDAFFPTDMGPLHDRSDLLSDLRASLF
jgi:SAM-dependent methyltransferase